MLVIYQQISSTWSKKQKNKWVNFISFLLVFKAFKALTVCARRKWATMWPLRTDRPEQRPEIIWIHHWLNSICIAHSPQQHMILFSAQSFSCSFTVLQPSYTYFNFKHFADKVVAIKIAEVHRKRNYHKWIQASEVDARKPTKIKKSKWTQHNIKLIWWAIVRTTAFI